MVASAPRHSDESQTNAMRVRIEIPEFKKLLRQLHTLYYLLLRQRFLCSFHYLACIWMMNSALTTGLLSGGPVRSDDLGISRFQVINPVTGSVGSSEHGTAHYDKPHHFDVF